MVNRDPLTGWTATEVAELRMWFSFLTLVLVAMSFMRWVGFLDYFRLVFFCAPAWLTLIVSPFHSDRSTCKLVSYSCVLFLVFWTTVHCYPSQCRHAWGTAMVTDPSFYESDGAIADAILAEKNSYFSMGEVTERERLMFWPKGPPKNSTEDFHPTQRDSIKAALDIIKSEDNVTKDNLLVRKWIESWSGGLSMSILMLRAYCNIHQADYELPHVFPLRVLGVLNNQAHWTVPCPYWSCLMTEAKPNEKLPFLAVLGVVGFVNFLHARCMCTVCTCFSWYLGAGKPRLFWWWLWAALLPLWLVMFVKTTYDDEFLVVINHIFHEWWDPLADYIMDPEHSTYNRITLLALFASFAVVWRYRQKIKHDMGLEGFTLLSLLADRGEFVHEAMLTFQVCIWRVDVSQATQPKATPGSPTAAAPPDTESNSTEGLDTETSSSGPGVRSLMLCGSAASAAKRTRWRSLTGMFRRQEDSTVLKTADGKVPSLSVRVYYGLDEVQSTRSVKPTQDQWWNHEPVYFQENFKVSVEHRPKAGLRFELRDMTAAFGSMSLGSMTLDESALERLFLASKRANPQVRRHSVPIMQVVQMSMPPPITDDQEQQQVAQLKSLGFDQHRLTDGGAVWLALYETYDDHHAPSMACC